MTVVEVARVREAVRCVQVGLLERVTGVAQVGHVCAESVTRLLS